jgi:hypothetical protein
MKSSETIFIVTGGTGVYEDFREWQVAAFREESMANNFVEECNKESARIFEKIKKDYYGCNYRKLVEKGKLEAHKYDKDFDVDSNGTHYSYQELPIVDEY